MLRIKKWWEIEENLVVEALRGYVSERYGKDKPVCRKNLLKPVKAYKNSPRKSRGYKKILRKPC